MMMIMATMMIVSTTDDDNDDDDDESVVSALPVIQNAIWKWLHEFKELGYGAQRFSCSAELYLS